MHAWVSLIPCHIAFRIEPKNGLLESARTLVADAKEWDNIRRLEYLDLLNAASKHHDHILQVTLMYIEPTPTYFLMHIEAF